MWCKLIHNKGLHHMSRVILKQGFCMCKNKGADQLCSNCTADQGLCFRYIDRTISLLLKSEISSSSFLLVLHRQVCVRPGRTPQRPVFSHCGSYMENGPVVEQLTPCGEVWGSDPTSVNLCP